MPTIIAELTQYTIEIDAVLAWYPTKSESLLDQPRMRNATVSFSSSDETFWLGGTKPTGTLIRSLGGVTETEDALSLAEYAMAGFLSLSLNEHWTFELEVAVNLGNNEAKKKLVIDAEKVVPFMVNVAADVNDPLKFSSATLQGVVTTGPRPPFIRNMRSGINLGQLLSK